MNKNDLRYRKTEANLKQAYLTLLAEHACQSITVRQLCTVAQCARNTFYQHYVDLSALQDHIIGEVLADIANAFRPVATTLAQIDTQTNHQYVKNIIEGVSRQRQTLTVLLANDDGRFQKQLTNVIEAKVLAGDCDLSKVADTWPNRLNTAYLAAAIAGFITSWLAQPAVTAAMAEQTLLAIHQATMQTSAAYLALSPLKPKQASNIP